ncbi:DUF1206 domain-containing protein [Jannaschia sp. Os4]|uniref:DUF1206 domain-containing protein n=1 Tax=Jannaschia sp. Os4 TaxID=2807617 RepID=UPI00193AA868|nr:DUF1206 domain-containing protein [Jannaschia sp. Os4]MBM2576678.1 DUF1206 domain-containing protein [Jannaschia sp. Os4]
MADHRWAIPVMRAGYSGRGVTYLAVAGLSLWAIWRGGAAQGTESALASLSQSTWGVVVLWVIGIGLIAYAIWRGIDAAEDLEDYGTEGKGLIARAGMIVTGLIHGALGATAIGLALGDRSGGGQDGVTKAVDWALNLPGGRWIVGFAALCTIGAAIYYVHKGIAAKHREHLMANEFTRNYDWALRAGVIAQGVLIGIIGGFLAVAAWRASEGPAGGVGQAFDWLAGQPFGNVLVIAMCLGLLGFAFFCFVNAAYRIIPKVEGSGDLKTLGAALKSKVA